MDFTSRPIDLMRLAWSCAKLQRDAQQVIALRMLGLSGMRHMPSDEANRMVQEKPPVFAKAALTATMVGLRGGGLDHVMYAYVKPLSETARDNRLRLTGGGMPSDTDFDETEQ